ncbi:MAG: LytTR family transcriptional regulator [Flavobacteriales bacterium]|nr:LytTR family transcriptional regulator [Flavobacteriales bacterium]
MVSKTLKTYENLLKESGFYRVHQRHLVNQQYIREFVKQDGGYIRMKNDSTVPVSTRKRAEVVEMIASL